VTHPEDLLLYLAIFLAGVTCGNWLGRRATRVPPSTKEKT
jgi:hypothetical protein